MPRSKQQGNCCSCMWCTLNRLWPLSRSLKMCVWYESWGSWYVCVHAHFCMHSHLFQCLVMEALPVKIKIVLCKDRNEYSQLQWRKLCALYGTWLNYLIEVFTVINYLHCWKCDMEILFIMSKMCNTLTFKSNLFKH